MSYLILLFLVLQLDTMLINGLFSFLWQYRDMSNEILEAKATKFIQKYTADVSDHLLQEVKELKAIHEANFGDDEPLAPL